MATTQIPESAFAKPLRLWPGVLVAVIVVVLRFLVPLAVPTAAIYGVLAAAAGFVLILLWWLFFSRAPWPERIGALLLMVLATPATWLVVDPSISGGMMGRMLFGFLLPGTLGPALVVWAAASRRSSPALRRATMVAAIFLGALVWTLVRTDGVSGDVGAQLQWRWTPTAEERLLAQTRDEALPAPPPAAPAAEATAPNIPTVVTGDKTPVPPTARDSVAPVPDPGSTAVALPWNGFRGPQRDGVVRGVRLNTDWERAKPIEVWRRPIGPGWSSFSVRGELVYTQEQRGEEEMVSAYRLSTGAPVWRHRDPVRFYESNGGPGPRGTPTVHGDRVYTLGATGIVNALDAGNGAVVWSRNAQADTGAPLPGWGFTSSPLIFGDVVIVAASGRLVGYDIATGNPRWTRATGSGGYSSPHFATIDGVPQVLLPNGGGVTSVAPGDGAVLWRHPGEGGTSILQPAFTPDGDVLIAGGDMMGGTGIRRLDVSQGAAGWTVAERWATRGLKPYFNDFVVHKEHAFGFDGTILSCISLADGERKWKGGRYGAGQMILLPEQDLLLVVSEDGELALVSATPDQHTELAKFKAIEGKTWNHPVLLGELLLVRNGEEMAAFRLPRAAR